MYVVTGGAGFIGSNIVRSLNERGINDILVVDDLTEGQKFVNISDLDIADYMDKTEFLDRLKANTLPVDINAIFHEGACSATTEWDGRFMMENNYTYSKHLLDYCLANGVAFLYASSAATYGGRNGDFIEEKAFENPLNVYGYSKLQLDNYVRRLLPTAKSQIVGFRYFNVYGPREQHKGSMASVAYHLNGQIHKGENVKLFEGCDGYPDGGQQRDFVYVDDICKVNLWFADHPGVSGIFNVGTGRSEPFRAVATAVIDYHKKGEIEYIPFPEHLKGRYQSFTQADLGKLRAAGYNHEFHTVAEGVAKYMAWLNR